MLYGLLLFGLVAVVAFLVGAALWSAVDGVRRERRQDAVDAGVRPGWWDDEVAT